MNLRKAASRSGGIDISDNPLSTQESDSSTPEPPAPVMISTVSPFGVRSTGTPQAAGADHARLRQHVLIDLVVTRERTGVRGRGFRAGRGAAGLEHDDRLLL